MTEQRHEQPDLDDVEGHRLRSGGADAEHAEGDDVEGHRAARG